VAQQFDAVIIGAGHNGLVAACYLARSGMQVCVLEKRHIVGGACVTEEVYPGFKYSVASYLSSLLQQKVIRELEMEKFGYEVYPKNPAFFSPFPDGQSLIMYSDMAATCKEIRKFSAHDAEEYPKYEQYMDRLARFVEPLLLEAPPQLGGRSMDDLLALLRLGNRIRKTPRPVLEGHIRIFSQSVKDFLDRWFESDQLKVALATDGVIGTNAGPRSPGTAYVLMHHLMGGVGGVRGLWGFVKGGMGGVTQALASFAMSRGVQIRTEAPVAGVKLRDGRAMGVVLQNGDEIEGKVVVSGLDPKLTFLKLVGARHLSPEFGAAIKAIRIEGVSMKINLALDGLPNFRCAPGTGAGPHHKTTIHICPSVEYMERAYDDSKYGFPSARPMLEMTIPTTYDSTLAPAGKHVMNVFLQYTPYSLSKDVAPNWHAVKESYADRVMDMIEEYAPAFKSLVLHRQVLSPLDLEEQFGLTGGNIFHGEMTLDQLFWMRPVAGCARYRTPIQGLYLCGSGTHPGGGVMGAPGHNAAREILRDVKAS
jgi:phytoene dehydrogenase-like protein